MILNFSLPLACLTSSHQRRGVPECVVNGGVSALSLESARNGHCAAAVNSEGSSPSARPSLFYLSHRQKAAAATSNNQVIGGNLPPDTDHYGKGEIEVVGWPNGIAGQNLFHSTEMPGKGKECGRTSRLEQHTL